MDLRTTIIDEIIATEGDYSNDANDAGGETRYGVTVAEARAAGYAGPMRDMPRDLAVTIFGAKYLDPIRFDDLAALSGPTAAELADTAVNLGVARAGNLLQTALNVFNKGGALYPDLTVDGAIGPATVAALAAYLRSRRADDGETVMLRALNALQGAFYIHLALAKTTQEDFVFGWVRNRVKI